MTDAAKVAVVGLGSMGLGIALRQAEFGRVAGSDPIEHRRALAGDGGVATFVTAADAVADAAHVVIAARDGAQVESALFADGGVLDGATPGAVIILTSTIGATAAKRLHAALERHGLF